ncbi:hypothetical protein ACM6T0_005023 [Enterobacter kobei]
MFAGKKSAQIREILISESAWEEMTCLFAPSLIDEVTAVESTAEKEGLDAGKIAAQKLGSLMRKYHNKLGVD